MACNGGYYEVSSVPDDAVAAAGLSYFTRMLWQDSCILRIPVIYGGEESIGESAISVLIYAIQVESQTSVSNFEIRFPSHTRDIAGIIYELVQRKLQDQSLKSNIYHWCGSEPFTKYEMARIIAETFGQSHEHIIPFNLPSPGTPRPTNCQMICERLENLGIRRHTRFVEGIEDFRKFFE
ncbi:Methionine adenosyltransferase 2 subunit beta [Araneus ventricosus]|uniref:Methionine adenosyltransferase 2 subunit beta n=1 Tax=Araneus ventricosus TaxID=182803 RepID=A0A4Y2EPZ2_ARAVE|nr:Methionine adenosyltransferase 2 subunit beta [Araneus ventricosus]